MRRKRCAWATGNDLLESYHDNEWGTPQYDDTVLFEFLTLEGAQAGLSWTTILSKREGYRRAFKRYNLKRISSMSDHDMSKLMHDPGIVRNRRKIESVRANARACLAIQKEFGSLSNYFWRFVNHTPIHEIRKTPHDIPTHTRVSEEISRDLKKRGCHFVGQTILYAYMQAVGMVQDHTIDCFRAKKISKRRSPGYN